MYLIYHISEPVVLQSAGFIEVSSELSLSLKFPQETFLSGRKTVALHHFHEVNS